MERIFQNGNKDAVRLNNVIPESEGRVNHWEDTLYLITLVLKDANKYAYLSAFLF